VGYLDSYYGSASLGSRQDPAPADSLGPSSCAVAALGQTLACMPPGVHCSALDSDESGLVVLPSL
jgi:hypothetical protein